MGKGPKDAPLMIVGEQPGDREDLTGQPFVGPAGQLFDDIAATAGLVRDAVYVTNAVKHFKYIPRGKRRIHQSPNRSEITACRYWLDQEIAQVQPMLIVAMGSTAAQALTGNNAALMARCGRVEQSLEGLPVLITLHPAAILRSDTPAPLRAQLQADLQRASEMLIAAAARTAG